MYVLQIEFNASVLLMCYRSGNLLGQRNEEMPQECRVALFLR